MNIELQEWQARYILEALRALEQQWRDTAAKSDEDTAADIGNDMIRLTAAHDHIEREALKAFVPAVAQFHGAAIPQANEQPRVA
jgi:hypothetical protein